MVKLRSHELLPFLTSLTVWLLMGGLSFIQAGCTQDTNSPTAILAATQSSPASPSETSSKTTPDLSDGKNDRSETGVQSRADFSLVVGETNDDGLPEEISVCETSKVCIVTLETGAKRMYGNGLWHTVNLVGVEDTDGEAGAEIVVVAYTRDGQLACICIIHDKTQSIQFYRGQTWSSAKVEILEDTDDIGGKEVLLQIRDENGKIQCLCLIHDRDRTVRAYSDLAWVTVHVKAVTDTDGQPGKEVIFESRSLVNEILCVCVIRDRKDELTTYTDSQWQTGEVQLLTDTDGQSGQEIIVTFMSNSNSGITIIHDVSGTSKTYLFDGKYTIQQIGNYDRSQGDEICVLLSASEKTVMITDRVHEQRVVESCGQSQRSPAQG
jgi:hypothetical protein